jgi:hypothetical protein
MIYWPKVWRLELGVFSDGKSWLVSCPHVCESCYHVGGTVGMHVPT